MQGNIVDIKATNATDPSPQALDVQTGRSEAGRKYASGTSANTTAPVVSKNVQKRRLRNDGLSLEAVSVEFFAFLASFRRADPPRRILLDSFPRNYRGMYFGLIVVIVRIENLCYAN